MAHIIYIFHPHPSRAAQLEKEIEFEKIHFLFFEFQCYNNRYKCIRGC